MTVRVVPIARRPATALQPNRLAETSEPIVVTDWPAAAALEEQLDIVRLKYEFAERPVILEAGTFGHTPWSQWEMPFLHAVNRVLEARRVPMHVAQLDVVERLPELAERLDLSSLSPVRWSSHPLLWIASAGTVTRTHFDHGHNSNVQICGQKRVLLAHPRFSPLLGSIDREGVEHFAHTDLADVVDRGVEVAGPLEVIEAILGPGEVLRIPRLWWHHFDSIEPTVNLNVFWRSGAQLARDAIDYVARRGRSLDRGSDVQYRLLGRTVRF